MYQIREKTMGMALKWAECQINEVDHKSLLKVAQDIESYLEGTWGEPGGCKEEEYEPFLTVKLPAGSYVSEFSDKIHTNPPESSEQGKQETRSDRLRANRREKGGLVTLTFPGYLGDPMDFSVSGTTQEQD